MLKIISLCKGISQVLMLTVRACCALQRACTNGMCSGKSCSKSRLREWRCKAEGLCAVAAHSEGQQKSTCSADSGTENYTVQLYKKWTFVLSFLILTILMFQSGMKAKAFPEHSLMHPPIFQVNLNTSI